jgi:hypothetical protein
MVPCICQQVTVDCSYVCLLTWREVYDQASPALRLEQGREQLPVQTCVFVALMLQQGAVSSCELQARHQKCHSHCLPPHDSTPWAYVAHRVCWSDLQRVCTHATCRSLPLLETAAHVLPPYAALLYTCSKAPLVYVSRMCRVYVTCAGPYRCWRQLRTC